MKTNFADANADYKESVYVICGVPFDGTSSFRKGSRFAPKEIRKNSYNFEKYSSFHDIDLSEIKINDNGDLEVGNDINDIDSTLEMISPYAERFVRDGKISIMLGGEHSLTFPFVKAYKKKYPDLGIVVLDAHMDMRQEYCDIKNSHACISRNIIDELTKKYASIGIRSGTKEEYEYVKMQHIKSYSAEEVFSYGIETIIREIRNFMKCPIYLSVDMDAIDPAYAPALGTPEPYGLSPRDIRDVISGLAPNIVGFDLVEIAPEYDSGGTALLGAKIVRDFIAASTKARKNNKVNSCKG